MGKMGACDLSGAHFSHHTFPGKIFGVHGNFLKKETGPHLKGDVLCSKTRR
jgi:hypothetical protein